MCSRATAILWFRTVYAVDAASGEEGRQNAVIAHLMADDFLLAYVDDQEVTELFNSIREGY